MEVQAMNGAQQGMPKPSWFVHVDLEVRYEESATYRYRGNLSTRFSALDLC